MSSSNTPNRAGSTPSTSNSLEMSHTHDAEVDLLAHHQLSEVVEGLLYALMRDQPDDHVAYTARWLTNLRAKLEAIALASSRHTATGTGEEESPSYIATALPAVNLFSIEGNRLTAPYHPDEVPGPFLLTRSVSHPSVTGRPLVAEKRGIPRATSLSNSNSATGASTSLPLMLPPLLNNRSPTTLPQPQLCSSGGATHTPPGSAEAIPVSTHTLRSGLVPQGKRRHRFLPVYPEGDKAMLQFEGSHPTSGSINNNNNNNSTSKLFNSLPPLVEPPGILNNTTSSSINTSNNNIARQTSNISSNASQMVLALKQRVAESQKCLERGESLSSIAEPLLVTSPPKAILASSPLPRNNCTTTKNSNNNSNNNNNNNTKNYNNYFKEISGSGTMNSNTSTPNSNVTKLFNTLIDAVSSNSCNDYPKQQQQQQQQQQHSSCRVLQQQRSLSPKLSPRRVVEVLAQSAASNWTVNDADSGGESQTTPVEVALHQPPPLSTSASTPPPSTLATPEAEAAKTPSAQGVITAEASAGKSPTVVVLSQSQGESHRTPSKLPLPFSDSRASLDRLETVAVCSQSTVVSPMSSGLDDSKKNEKDDDKASNSGSATAKPSISENDATTPCTCAPSPVKSEGKRETLEIPQQPEKTEGEAKNSNTPEPPALNISPSTPLSAPPLGEEQAIEKDKNKNVGTTNENGGTHIKSRYSAFSLTSPPTHDLDSAGTSERSSGQPTSKRNSSMKRANIIPPTTTTVEEVVKSVEDVHAEDLADVLHYIKELKECRATGKDKKSLLNFSSKRSSSTTALRRRTSSKIQRQMLQLQQVQQMQNASVTGGLLSGRGGRNRGITSAGGGGPSSFVPPALQSPSQQSSFLPPALQSPPQPPSLHPIPFMTSVSGPNDSTSSPNLSPRLFPPMTPSTAQDPSRRKGVSAVPLNMDSAKEFQLKVVEKSEDEIKQLQDCMQRSTALSQVEEYAREPIISAMYRMTFAAGEEVLQQGRKGRDMFFLIVKGRVEVLRDHKVVVALGPGEYFGELEIMYENACYATVKCITPIETFVLEKEVYQRYMLNTTLERRKKFMGQIECVDFFKHLQDYDKMRLAEALSTHKLEMDDYLIRRGESIGCIYIVMKGKLRILGQNKDTGQREEICIVGPGEVVGELEFLFQHTAVADVIAIDREVEVAQLSREHFKTILGDSIDDLKALLSQSGDKYAHYLQNAANKEIRQDIQTQCRRLEAVNSQYRGFHSFSQRPHQSVSQHPQQSVTVIPASISQVPHVSPREPLPRPPSLGDVVDANENTLTDSAGGGEAVSSLLPSIQLAEIPDPSWNTVGTEDEVAQDGEIILGNLGVAGSEMMMRGAFSFNGATKSVPDVPMLGAVARFPAEVTAGDNLVLIALQEDGTVLYWNPVIARLTQFKPADVVGQSIFIFLINEDDQKNLHSMLKLARKWAGNWEGLVNSGGMMREMLEFTQASGLYKVQIVATCAPPTVRQPPMRPEILLLVGHEVKRKAPNTAVDHNQWFLDTLKPQLNKLLAVSDDLLEEQSEMDSMLDLNKKDPKRAVTITVEAQTVKGLRSAASNIRKLLDQFTPLSALRGVEESWHPVSISVMMNAFITQLSTEVRDNHNTLEVNIKDDVPTTEVFVDVNMLSESLLYLARDCNRYCNESVIEMIVEVVSAKSAELHDNKALNTTTSSEQQAPLTDREPRGNCSLSMQKSTSLRLGTGRKQLLKPSVVTIHTDDDNNGEHHNTTHHTPATATGTGSSSAGASHTEVPTFLCPITDTDTVGNNSHSVSIAGDLLPFDICDDDGLGTRHVSRNDNGDLLNPSTNTGSNACPLNMSPNGPSPLGFLARTTSSVVRTISVSPSTNHAASVHFGSPGGGMFGASTRAASNGNVNNNDQDCSMLDGTVVEDEDGNEAGGYRMLRFTVKDNGKGIPRQQLKGIMQNIARVSRNSTRRVSTHYDGNDDDSSVTGVGLVRVGQMVARMAGVFDIKSIPDIPKGTEFTITIPLVMEASNTEGEKTEEAGSPRGGAGGGGGRQNFTTVLVETSTVHRNMICQILWGRQHAVLPALTWRDIKRLLEANTCDILIIDPDSLADEGDADPGLRIDPLETLAQYTRQICVIVTSENFADTHVGAVTNSGVIAIPKPCPAALLHNVIVQAENQMKTIRAEAHRIAKLRETFSKTNRGQIRTIRLLGRGAFGEVYEVEDVLTHGRMAMKSFIVKNSTKTDDLLNEITAMTALQHENIIHYFYCEKVDDKNLKIFMELASGGTVDDLLKSRVGEGLQMDMLIKCVRDMLQGIAYIHSKNYVHCDIKPQNVLLDSEGRCKLGDFGTARQLAPGQLEYEMKGTPNYMAPEVVEADSTTMQGYDTKADIWSLGVSVLEMATGRPPFYHIEGAKGMGMLKYVTDLKERGEAPDLSPLFSTSPLIFEFVKACLEPNVEKRPTAKELLSYSLVTDGGSAKQADKLLRRAQLLHVLNQFVAFQSPQGSECSEYSEESEESNVGCGVNEWTDSDDEEADEKDNDANENPPTSSGADKAESDNPLGESKQTDGNKNPASSSSTNCNISLVHQSTQSFSPSRLETTTGPDPPSVPTEQLSSSHCNTGRRRYNSKRQKHSKELDAHLSQLAERDFFDSDDEDAVEEGDGESKTTRSTSSLHDNNNNGSRSTPSRQTPGEKNVTPRLGPLQPPPGSNSPQGGEGKALGSIKALSIGSSQRRGGSIRGAVSVLIPEESKDSEDYSILIDQPKTDNSRRHRRSNRRVSSGSPVAMVPAIHRLDSTSIIATQSAGSSEGPQEAPSTAVVPSLLGGANRVHSAQRSPRSPRRRCSNSTDLEELYHRTLSGVRDGYGASMKRSAITQGANGELIDLPSRVAPLMDAEVAALDAQTENSIEVPTPKKESGYDSFAKEEAE